jgi:hypothetical protein
MIVQLLVDSKKKGKHPSHWSLLPSVKMGFEQKCHHPYVVSAEEIMGAID